MNDDDHAFFDDDYDASIDKGEFMSAQSPRATGSGGSGKFDIHCDLHGSSSSQNNKQHQSEKNSRKQKREKSYDSDSSSSSGKEDEDELFSPRPLSAGSLSGKSRDGKKPYDKEDYDRDVSKRSNSPLVLTSSDSDDDTLTDVSPRSSPAGSPSSTKRSFRFSFSDDDSEEQPSGSGEQAKQRRNDDSKRWSAQAQPEPSSEEEEEVKHITKLNVTFKSSEGGSRKHHHPEQLHREPASRKHKTKTRKLHRGEGDCLSIDHIEGSLSRYFDKSKEDRPKSSSSQRRRSGKGRQRSIDEPIDDVASAQRQQPGTEDGFIGGDDKEAEESVDLNHLFEMILDLEERGVNVKERFKEHSTKRQASRQNQQQQRKNMSFSNDQARQIDRENSRLYREITKRASSASAAQHRNRPSSSTSVRSRQSLRSNASSGARSSASTLGGGRRSGSRMSSGSSSLGHYRQHAAAAPKLYHSAVNRINSQRQIERENMQLLKRLQEAKPTPSLQRTNQLRDYSRQTRYMGSPATAATTTSRRTRRYAAELARDPEVVRQALDIGEQRFRQIRPAWQDVW